MHAPRAAILVIHGIGEQLPFQALDAFARGLATRLEVQSKQLEHRLVRRGGRTDSAVRIPLREPLPRAGARVLDVHEHYWAGSVQGRIGLWPVLKWLARTSLTPLTAWAEQPAVLFLEAGPDADLVAFSRRRLGIFVREVARALVLVLVAALIVLPFAYAAGNQAEVLRAVRSLGSTLSELGHPVAGIICLTLAGFAVLVLRGGLRLLRRRAHPQAWLDAATARWWAGASVAAGGALLTMAAVIYWWFGLDAPTWLALIWADIGSTPVLLPVLATLIALGARSVLIKFVGDIALYVTADERSGFFRTRQEILKDASEHLRALLEDDDYSAVYVAGHSLGSVIGYDSINRLARELRATPAAAPAASAAAPALSQAAFDKLYGLLTFGSPLDKVYYFFRTMVRAEEAVRAQVLNSIHGFHQRASGRDYGRFRFARYEIPEPAHFQWLNVYSRADLVSGWLDFYHVTRQRVRPYSNLITAHVRYWEDPAFYGEVAAWL
ncbi:MAG TPA: hypothetical protein VJL31_12125 [Gemmatimonadales bacterium]|nr:hypothetical protein [Gemmatimonadales bacterium]